MWRPTGPPDDELAAYLLGRVPSLISHEPIYESAWKERCRLVTIPAGKIFLELYVITRFYRKQNIDMLEQQGSISETKIM